MGDGRPVIDLFGATGVLGDVGICQAGEGRGNLEDCGGGGNQVQGQRRHDLGVLLEEGSLEMGNGGEMIGRENYRVLWRLWGSGKS